jgi:hypothetical protein
MVDADKIKHILDQDFQIEGEVHILPDGSVDVQGKVVHVTKQKKLRVKFNHVSGNFISKWRGLIDLSGLPDHVGGRMVITYYPKIKGMLRLLVARYVDLQSTTYKDYFKTDQQRRQIAQILQQYEGQGKAGAIRAAVDLINAGYKEHARW